MIDDVQLWFSQHQWSGLDTYVQSLIRYIRMLRFKSRTVIVGPVLMIYVRGSRMFSMRTNGCGVAFVEAASGKCLVSTVANDISFGNFLQLHVSGRKLNTYYVYI